MTFQTRAQLFRELAVLTRAGLSLTKAETILGSQRGSEEKGRLWKALREGVGRGDSLAQALAPELTGMELAIIDAAERGGQLPRGFSHLEKYYEMLGAAYRAVKSGLVYPLFVVHVAALLPTLVLAVVAKANPLWPMCRSLLGLWVVLFLVYLAGRSLLRMAARSASVDSVLSVVPVLGKAHRSFAVARWATVFYFYLNAAQRLSVGTEAAGKASQSANLDAASARIAAKIVAGDAIGPALVMERAFPKTFSRSLLVAEEAGTLDKETEYQAQQAMADATHSARVLTEWLPRVFYGFVAIFVIYRIFQMASVYQTALSGIGGAF
jgi:type IV pilus assembly protein PilC